MITEFASDDTLFAGKVIGKCARWGYDYACQGLCIEQKDTGLHRMIFRYSGRFFSPVVNAVGMMLAGPLYLLWFPLLARDFFRISQSKE